MKTSITYTLVVLCLTLFCGKEVVTAEEISPTKMVTDASTPAMTTPTTVNETTELPTTIFDMTTASPAPPPEVSGNHLNFSKGGKSCILEHLNATFMVTDDKGTKYYIMDKAEVIAENSSCGDKAKKQPAVLAAKWESKDGKSNFTQEFGVEKDYYYLKHVTVFLANATYNFSFTLKDKKTLMTHYNRSYKCDTNQTITFNQTKDKANLSMSFSEVRFQAFDVQKSNFSKADSCPGDTPAPVPEPNWSNNLTVTYKNKSACILEIMNVTFLVKYLDEKNKTQYHTFNMTGATVNEGSSKCGNKTAKEDAVVAAVWGDNSMTQTFAVKGSYYYLRNISLHLKRKEGKLDYHYKINLDDIKDQSTTFYTPFGSSLRCNSTQKVQSGNLTIKFSDVRFQAYDVVNNTFSKEHECAADNAMSNIVPIAVGAALAVLVIIVLIAYLIGRRSSSRAGYESV